MNRLFAALLLVFFTLGNTMATAQTTAAAEPSHSAPAAHAMTAQDLEAFFGGMFPYAIHRADIAGTVVIVVKDGKVLFDHGYGYADVAKETPIYPDRTLFRPGSVSKLFTWTAVMQQVERGKIDLDADVNQYLDFRIPETYGKITMRNLMTHSGGFEETIKELFVDKASQTYPIGQYLRKHMPGEIFPPGTVIAYSNYGATLAGYIVQRVSGEQFDDYVQKHIFTPLHMDHSTFEQPLPARLEPLMSKGYGTASGKPRHFEFVEAAPAGSLTSTATDMAKFMLAYLNGGTYEGYQMLKPATVKEMWTLQLAPAPGMPGFDLGFYQEDRNGQMIVSHAGDTDAFHSDLHLLPKQNVGFFMSLNSAGKAGAAEDVRTQLFRLFLDRYYPYTPPAEATVADPKKDAARVAGWYQSSRRVGRALHLVYALGQISVTAHPDGTVEVSMLKTPGESPIQWREVGPLYYREIGGQSHLKFVTDSNGNVISFTTSSFIPVFIFQRVNGLASLGSIKLLLPLFLAIVIISLLVRLGAWIARRKLKLTLGLSREVQWIHLAARIGAIAFLVALAGWVLSLSGGGALFDPSTAWLMVVLYILGVIAIIGGFAMIAETIIRVMRGPGGWLVRTGEIIVGLAAVYGIWFFIAMGLANFVTNF